MKLPKIGSGAVEWDQMVELYGGYSAQLVSIEDLYEAFKARLELERHSPTCDKRNPPYDEPGGFACTCGVES